MDESNAPVQSMASQMAIYMISALSPNVANILRSIRHEMHSKGKCTLESTLSYISLIIRAYAIQS